ncbi:MAG: hypothetical protein WBP16_03425 [Ferruginibacter sp.]
MKKSFISTLPGLILLIALSSCFHNHNFSISISDDEDEYEMDARYQKSRTHAVEVYLNEHLIKKGSVSFKKELKDNEIMLDDNTIVYINSYPGKLKIKVDKDKNRGKSCEAVKEVCEDIKDLLVDY